MTELSMNVFNNLGRDTDSDPKVRHIMSQNSMTDDPDR